MTTTPLADLTVPTQRQLGADNFMNSRIVFNFLSSLLIGVQALSGAGGTQTDLIFDAATTLTIASGAIVVTQGAHKIDTEAAAASDDLTDITGGTAEEVVFVRAANAGRTVVIKHAIGANKIACPSGLDISLAEATDYAMLSYNGTQWVVIAYSTLAAVHVTLAALAAITTGAGASLVGIEDVAVWYAAANVEAALVELKTIIGSATSTTYNFTGGTGTLLTDNDAVYAALNKLDLGFVALLAITNGNGASRVGLEDTGTWYTGLNLEVALAEIAIAIGGANSTTRAYSSTNYVAANDTLVVALGKLDTALKSARDRVDAYQDQLVTAAIAVADVAGGGTASALTLQLKRAYDNGTNPATTCQVWIGCSMTQYQGFVGEPGVSGVTFGTATIGSIIASGSGWALVETDATGGFACTCSNTADGTFYFNVETPRGCSDLGKRAAVVASNSDSAAWAA